MVILIYCLFLKTFYFVLRYSWLTNNVVIISGEEGSDSTIYIHVSILWNSNTLVTWCKDLTHLKRPWCWERLKAGEEREDRGWDGWIASSTQWTWVWVNSGNWWWTGRPGMLQSMGSHRIGHDWVTELNWTDPFSPKPLSFPGCHITLSRVPCAVQEVLIGYAF